MAPNQDEPQTIRSDEEPALTVQSKHQPEPKGHWYHKHGDIILQASNGMLFKTYKWKLAESSEFFASMFEAASPSIKHNNDTPEEDESIDQELRNTIKATSGEAGTGSRGRSTLNDMTQADTTPIELDASANLLEAFLNLISVSIPVIPEDSDLEDMHNLFKLCEKLLCCERIVKAVKTAMHDKVSSAPWNALQFASTRNDVTLAREALSNMNMDAFCDTEWLDMRESSDDGLTYGNPGDSFWQRIRRLPPAWQAELLYITFNEPARVKEDEPARAMVSLEDHREHWKKFNPDAPHDCEILKSEPSTIIESNAAITATGDDDNEIWSGW